MIISLFSRFLIIFVACLLSGFLLVDAYFLTQNELAVKPIPTLNPNQLVKPNPNSLVYRLIKIEEDLGNVQGGETAKKKYDFFMHKARAIPTPKPKRAEVYRYFKAINALIDTYFFYETETKLIDGFNNQGIDCDLRSYLFYDLSKKRGVDVSLVYSPGHAFVVWNAPKNTAKPEKDLFWETTAVGGREAFFKYGSRVYRPSDDPNDYKPKDAQYAIDQYTLFSVFDLTDTATPAAKEKLFDYYLNYKGDVQKSELYQLGKYEIAYRRSGNKVSKALLKRTQEALKGSKAYESYADALAVVHYSDKGWKERTQKHYEKLPPYMRSDELRMRYAKAKESPLLVLNEHGVRMFTRLMRNKVFEEEVAAASYHLIYLAFVLVATLAIFLFSLVLFPVRRRNI